MATGIYTGSTTNTAALAGVLDYMSSNYDPVTAGQLADQAVIGYSFSYPMGVLGGMIAIVLAQRVAERSTIECRSEEVAQGSYPLDDHLTSRAVEVSNPEVCGRDLRDVMLSYDWNINFGRIVKDGQLEPYQLGHQLPGRGHHHHSGW